MSRRSQDDDLPLFDLPLGGVPPVAEPPAHRTAAPPPLTPTALEEPTEAPTRGAPLGPRCVAGLADFAVHLALLLGLLFGVQGLGVQVVLTDWPAFGSFLLAFSFVYTAVPLVFWGRTPGMRWAGVSARALAGGGLTLGETTRRWFGGLLTLALLGLPLLLTIGGRRSLADRLSGSSTHLI